MQKIYHRECNLTVISFWYKKYVSLDDLCFRYEAECKSFDFPGTGQKKEDLTKFFHSLQCFRGKIIKVTEFYCSLKFDEYNHITSVYLDGDLTHISKLQ